MGTNTNTSTSTTTNANPSDGSWHRTWFSQNGFGNSGNDAGNGGGSNTDVTLNPSVNALPGGGTLQELTNGLGAWALVASLAGLVIGAAAWALGVHSQNYQQSMIGRRAVLVSGLAALLVGAAPTIINFFFHAGTGLH